MRWSHSASERNPGYKKALIRQTIRGQKNQERGPIIQREREREGDLGPGGIWPWVPWQLGDTCRVESGRSRRRWALQFQTRFNPEKKKLRINCKKLWSWFEEIEIAMDWESYLFSLRKREMCGEEWEKSGRRRRRRERISQKSIFFFFLPCFSVRSFRRKNRDCNEKLDLFCMACIKVYCRLVRGSLAHVCGQRTTKLVLYHTRSRIRAVPRWWFWC